MLPMTFVSDAPAIRDNPAADVVERLDTTAGSLVHRLFWRARPGVDATKVLPHLAIAAATCVLVTYVPLLIAAWVTLRSLTTPYDAVVLPFLHDWNVMFMFLVTMPALVAYLVNDQRVLTTALGRTVRDESLELSVADAIALSAEWKTLFYRVNVSAQVIGALIGAALAWTNYHVYSPATVGYWTMHDDRLTGAGVVFLWGVFLFFTLTVVYVVRSVAVTFFLRALLKCSNIRVVPFHPDGSGGLRPVGAIGLNNQYLLTIYGLNVISFWVVKQSLNVPGELRALMIAAAVMYAVVGPIVFMAPLVQFRAGMRRAKAELMNEVAQRIRLELERIRVKLRKDDITKADEELIDRLRKIGAVINDLPVWPFDVPTVRKFLTAYLVPFVTIGFPLLKKGFDYISKQFG
jgi:hypothetical protein